MAIQLLNDNFNVSSKIRNILVVCYTAYALKYPNRNQSYIKKAVGLWRKLHIEKCGVDPLICPICGRELEFIAAFFPKQLLIMGLCFELVPQFLMN